MSNFKEIEIIDGHMIIVDAQDYDRVLSAGTWNIRNGRQFVYGRFQENGRRKWVSLGAFIMGCSEVKHINGDSFDCRRSNLLPRLPDNSDFIREDGVLGHVLDSFGQQIAVVDSLDIDRARMVRWWKDAKRGVIGKLPDLRQVKLHRWILRLQPNDPRAVLFKDGDSSNCRRDNMLIVKNRTALRDYQRTFNEYVVKGDTSFIKANYRNTVVEIQVDTSDVQILERYGRWCVHGDNERYLYAVGVDFNGRQIRMHRLITGAQKDDVVDHIDGNTLNNRRSNLRITNVRGNILNRHALSRGISGDVNVFFLKHLTCRKWLVNLRDKGKSVHWSRHETLEEAHEMAKLARAMYYPTSKEGTAVKFNLGGYVDSSSVNGPGNRCVVWIAGCRRGCSGCFNPELWSFHPRTLISPEELAARVLESGANGLTVSGGDPMDSPLATFRFLKALHDSDGNLDSRLPGGIILFTGMVIEELDGVQRQCLNYIDLLIDGRFEENKRVGHVLAGSSNQRFHFLDKPGRGRDKIDPAEVQIDQAVEVHLGEDAVEVTGFPAINRRWLKEHGLRVIS